MSFLNLIRYKNLLMIAGIQILIKYALLLPFNVSIMLNWFGFSLLVIATLCIAAGGYIINDINDIETDSVNEPNTVIVGNSISKNTAYGLFIAFNVIGVIIGFYLSHLVGKSGFFSIFVITSILLYLYSTYLKQMLLIGNFLVSALVAFTIIIVGLFELFPAITESNMQTQQTFFKILLDYALFAFILTFVREIAKDLEDIDGDYKAGMNTMPIAIGRERAVRVLFSVSLIPIIAVVYYIFTYLYKQQLAVLYFLFAVVAPLIYVSIKCYNAMTKKEFSHISLMLKIVMLTGILSTLLYKYILL